MEPQEKYEKFLALPTDKQERIINASMKEFLQGYKKATTDSIVKEAGISKGLLFHYFGTKEGLYTFLIDHGIDILQREYISLINTHQPDILESIWQLALLKQDVSLHFPVIFDFLTMAHVDKGAHSLPSSVSLEKFAAIQAGMMADVYAHADMSLFKDDIDPKIAMEIIGWTMAGYGQSKAAQVATVRENYEIFLEEFQQILNTLRQCFYK